jgi:uncharacterized protein
VYARGQTDYRQPATSGGGKPPVDRHDGRVRIEIRVRPGASRTQVGGSHGDALVVAVTAPAVEGRATEAALTAVAKAFDVRRPAVRLIAGTTSRTKIIEIDGPSDDLMNRLSQLMGRK